MQKENKHIHACLMCNYKILSHNEDGYIILCHSCKHYQMAFGTTAVTFEPQDFKRFCRQVHGLNNTMHSNGFDWQKRIPVKIFCKCVMMVLSYAELLRLHNLLEQASFSDEMDTLFENLNLIRE